MVFSMHGMGDNLFQRAIIRKLLAEGRRIFLNTPWPSIYHDLVGPNLTLVRTNSSLRTQAKNIQREMESYSGVAPVGLPTIRISYSNTLVKQKKSIPEAMMISSGFSLPAQYEMPLPMEWIEASYLKVPENTLPIIFYRPLVDRTEWHGCGARNPDAAAYQKLIESIREGFCLVSIADLQNGKEWISGGDIAADYRFHSGELTFKELAAIAYRAKLVFASPGFAFALAMAVGTPLVGVFGGHENSDAYSAPPPMNSAVLWLDTIAKCGCYDAKHKCDKRMDIPESMRKLRTFVNMLPTVTKQEVKTPSGIDWCGFQGFVKNRFLNPGEPEVLVGLMQGVNAKDVLEFGAHNGRTARLMLANVKTIERYLGVEVPPGFETTKQVQRGEVHQNPGEIGFVDPRFRILITGKGSHYLKPVDLGGKFDAVFIDGDHSAAGVIQDTTLALSSMRPGGLIIWHDYHDLGTVDVKQVLDGWMAKGWPIKLVAGTWIAYMTFNLAKYEL